LVSSSAGLRTVHVFLKKPPASPDKSDSILAGFPGVQAKAITRAPEHPSTGAPARQGVAGRQSTSFITAQPWRNPDARALLAAGGSPVTIILSCPVRLSQL
jgi:hypothetical protein